MTGEVVDHEVGRLRRKWQALEATEENRVLRNRIEKRILLTNS